MANVQRVPQLVYIYKRVARLCVCVRACVRVCVSVCLCVCLCTSKSDVIESYTGPPWPVKTVLNG